MKFLTVIPEKKEVKLIDAENFEAALKAVGLRSGHIDFGLLTDNIGFAVYEYGLMEWPQHYCSIAKRLLAGNIAMYQFDEDGETIDWHTPVQMINDAIEFYYDISEIEQAIADGKIIRPEMTVNGTVLWRWNDDR